VCVRASTCVERAAARARALRVCPVYTGAVLSTALDRPFPARVHPRSDLANIASTLRVAADEISRRRRRSRSTRGARTRRCPSVPRSRAPTGNDRASRGGIFQPGECQGDAARPNPDRVDRRARRTWLAKLTYRNLSRNASRPRRLSRAPPPLSPPASHARVVCSRVQQSLLTARCAESPSDVNLSGKSRTRLLCVGLE